MLAPLSDSVFKPGRDPTQTAGLRRRFRAAGHRQLNTARRLVYELLVERDYMQHRDPLQALAKAPIDRSAKLREFNAWLETVLQQTIGSDWTRSHVEAAYRSGLQAGAAITEMTPPAVVAPAAHHEAARQETRGIAAAVHQQASRIAYASVTRRMMPLVMYRSVLRHLRQTGGNRLNAFANFTTVQGHNAGRLEAFRSAGIRRVGVVPERIVARKPTRDHLHDARRRRLWRGRDPGWVNVLTAGDDLVCFVCEDISDEGPYPLEVAQGLIPAHPNCRCAFIPSGDERFASELV